MKGLPETLTSRDPFPDQVECNGNFSWREDWNVTLNREGVVFLTCLSSSHATALKYTHLLGPVADGCSDARVYTVCGVNLDWTKACDYVNHKAKLKSFGLDDIIVQWVETYLSGRISRVHAGGELSGTIRMQSGVPRWVRCCFLFLWCSWDC